MRTDLDESRFFYSTSHHWSIATFKNMKWSNSFPWITFFPYLEKLHRFSLTVKLYILRFRYVGRRVWAGCTFDLNFTSKYNYRYSVCESLSGRVTWNPWGVDEHYKILVKRKNTVNLYLIWKILPSIWLCDGSNKNVLDTKTQQCQTLKYTSDTW